MQKQNAITDMLLKQQTRSYLPSKDIPVFKGDPLTYRFFIRAFEHAVDSKTDSYQDKLYYLEQYTSGEPQELVRSCEHMSPDRSKALSTYALFLIGCRNMMDDTEFMEEMDNPTNMRVVISKLPYRIRERWRTTAFEIQEARRGQASFLT